MLPSPTERIIVALCPDEVALRSVGRKGEAVGEVATVKTEIKADAPLWSGALEALAELLPPKMEPRSFFSRRPKFSVIVSDRFARYAVLPWSATVRRDAEWQALAQAYLESQYGDMTGWTIRIDDRGYGIPRLACAIDSGLLEALRALLTERRLSCPHVESFFVSCWNRWCREVVSEDAVFVTQASGMSVLASRKAGLWHSVRMQGGLTAETLPQAIRREALLQGFPALPPAQVYVPSAQEWSDVEIRRLSLADSGADQQGGVAAMIQVGAPR